MVLSPKVDSSGVQTFPANSCNFGVGGHRHVGDATVDIPSNLGTGWRRLIGSLKLQIVFHKRATKCRSLLRKMTYTDKGSYESACRRCDG